MCSVFMGSNRTSVPVKLSCGVPGMCLDVNRDLVKAPKVRIPGGNGVFAQCVVNAVMRISSASPAKLKSKRTILPDILLSRLFAVLVGRLGSGSGVGSIVIKGAVQRF